MKELTIEEKAKRYDEALEKAKNYHSPETECNVRIAMENLFPEVKENDDEMIKKELIEYFKWNAEQILNNFDNKDVLAWLEKQVEKPSVIRWYNVSLIPQEMEELLVEWDSEDATWHEIAFYHADTKTFWNGTRQVENVTRWCYIIDLLEKQGENTYNKELPELLHKVICRFINDPNIPYSDREKVSMKVLPYVERLEKQGEQKSDWSNKEKLMLNDIIEATERSDIFMEDYQRELIDWLKSLKQRCTWKPSDEQVKQLGWIAEQNKDNMIGKELISLYQDLKKLRKE